MAKSDRAILEPRVTLTWAIRVLATVLLGLLIAQVPAWRVKSGDCAVLHRRKSRFLTLVTGRPRS